MVAIAASGYVLASKCILNKYRVARQNGHRLYLSSLTYGVYALVPALVLVGAWSLFLGVEHNLYVSAVLTFARDRDDQTFCLNHRYNTLIDGLIKKDESVISQSLNYMIAIPAERIITVHVFNEDLYQEIAGHPTEAIGDT
ncbi:hypothetical protein HH1059_04020 [Halorhodospira halochloris]|uniref:Uncharacterized protein n=1 Tax=Halorhodospira halochloris TaxID=1052 RepID=A0A2Z6EZC6_HALHR|nr:hypothetical protein [Halorhodospira halochloris]BBE10983.1 hypothetical protein HH1059_04020 [Halorhodospira halochloris]